MKTYTIRAVIATGIYSVEAETEEEARRKFEAWEDVTFSHYLEKWPQEVLAVEEAD